MWPELQLPVYEILGYTEHNIKKPGRIRAVVAALWLSAAARPLRLMELSILMNQPRTAIWAGVQHLLASNLAEVIDGLVTEPVPQALWDLPAYGHDLSFRLAAKERRQIRKTARRIRGAKLGVPVGLFDRLDEAMASLGHGPLPVWSDYERHLSALQAALSDETTVAQMPHHLRVATRKLGRRTRKVPVGSHKN